MSRRYGRNQRRRAREEVANLRVAMVMDRALTADIRRRLEMTRDELNRAKEIAGRMSIMFPADQEVPVPWKSSDRCTPRVVPKRPFDFLPSNFNAVSEIACRALDLEMLVASIARDALDDCLHVNVRFGDETWGYGITRRAWHSLNNPERAHVVREQISKQLACQIAQHSLR